MDPFVAEKLNKWGLGNLIEKFTEQKIDKESFHCLEEKDIETLIPEVGPRAKFRKNLKALKKSLQPVITSETENTNEDPISFVTQELPSTSTDGGKRSLDPAHETNEWQSPSKKRVSKLGSFSEGIILNEVKDIMCCVKTRLKQEKNRLHEFLRKKIEDLETDQRELVGVFGRTGAGKSSLINAIIGERNLLPTGNISACTSVMIKLEGNMHRQKYEAFIEFITVEEWRDELWSMFQLFRDEDEKENGDKDEYDASVEMLSALYGEEWKEKTPENLMDGKYFREIPEFLESRERIVMADSAKELSAKLLKYTRSVLDENEFKCIKRWYWPLVKCVTIKVPNNALLEHVTLVDLPGNGDRNKSRNKMWKELLGSCSTVWIVSESTRVVSDEQTWDILNGVSSLVGNGGQCQQLHFICTKSDQIGDSGNHSKDSIHKLILQKNSTVKTLVKKELLKNKRLKKHLPENCISVFTVSSTEFHNGKYLKPEETEIPQLQNVLKALNDCHSVVEQYMSGACGILSLIQGAYSAKEGGTRTVVCEQLQSKLKQQLMEMDSTVNETCNTFGRCLVEGVKNSKSSCEDKLKSILYPRRKNNGLSSTMKTTVKKGGVHKPKRWKQINLNMKLSSDLTDCIDEEFRKTFPNDGKSDLLHGAICRFSLGTEELIGKYKDEELQLRFLKTEEDKIKMKLNRIIRDRKKTIYHSLTDTITENMQECYKRAAEFKGSDTLKNIRDTLTQHVHHSKNFMFDKAKFEMVTLLKKLQEEIVKTTRETLMESIEFSLKTDFALIPDVSGELKQVKSYLAELK